MTTAPYPQVSNELLSAYIDEAVSEEERRLIESAVAQDPDVAWRLESLRATVRLLHELPALSLPRSFLLTPEQAGQGERAPLAVAVMPEAKRVQPGRVAPQASPAHEEGFWRKLWRGWMQLWQAGNPALRNAMAASFAALLVLLLAPRFVAAPSFSAPSSSELSSPALSSPAAGEAPIVASQAPAQSADEAGSDEAGGGEAGGGEAGGGEAGGGVEDAAAPAQETARLADSTPGTAAKVAGEAEGETTAAAMTAARETTNLAAAPAGAPAAAPVEASDALFTTVPAAPASAAEGATMAQADAGASVLDEMQRQAGGGAPAAAAAPLAESAAVEGAAQPASSGATGVASTERVAEEAAAESAAAVPAEVAAEVAAEDPTEIPVEVAAVPPPLPSPLATATENAAAIVLEPAAGDQGEDGNLPVTAPDPTAASPAWLALLLQSGAWLAAFATLLFGLLWWRSRPS